MRARKPSFLFLKETFFIECLGSLKKIIWVEVTLLNQTRILTRVSRPDYPLESHALHSEAPKWILF